MLIAELEGKIPSKLKNSEDLLTSSVFGILKYLSSPYYLQSILQGSFNSTGSNLNFDKELTLCNYVFWPRLNTSEPDLLLHLMDMGGSEYIICIEAKYYSGKSSEEDISIKIQNRNNSQRDQLAREIEDIHTDFCINLLNANKDKLQKRLLIYLTNDSVFPFESIEKSKQHIQKIDSSKLDIYWLSWSNIYLTLKNIHEYKTTQDALLLDDLKRFLENKGLGIFNGFTQNLKEVPLIKLDYDTSKVTINAWTNLLEVKTIDWKYGGSENGYK